MLNVVTPSVMAPPVMPKQGEERMKILFILPKRNFIPFCLRKECTDGVTNFNSKALKLQNALPERRIYLKWDL
jgi:hypothetical protein